MWATGCVRATEYPAPLEMCSLSLSLPPRLRHAPGRCVLCCFGLRRGMFLQLLILLPPAAYLWGSNLILSPTGNFLSIAKESHQRTPAETDGFWRHFFILFAAVGKSMPSETRSLRKAPLLTKSMPPVLKACRSSWKMRPLPVARCGRTDFRYIVFYRRTKSCFDQTAAPCSCGVS